MNIIVDAASIIIDKLIIIIKSANALLAAIELEDNYSVHLEALRSYFGHEKRNNVSLSKSLARRLEPIIYRK